jgi:hypothetical protein
VTVHLINVARRRSPAGRLILSGGQITDTPVQPPLQKYFGSLLTQITSTSSAIPAHTKGRFAIVTDVGQGMRWTQAALLTRALSCGRQSRVVLTPRRWRQVGERNFADDGGKQARSPGRARNKLLKPSRAGMPGDPGATVVTNARAYYSTRAAAGATGTRHSPLPHWGSAHALCWAKDSSITRASHAARMRICVCVPRMLRNALLLRRGALLIRGPCSTRVPALRCIVKNAAPRPGHVFAALAMTELTV